MAIETPLLSERAIFSSILVSQRTLRVGVLINSVLRNEGLNAGGHVHTLEVVRRWLLEPIEIVIFAPSFVEERIRERLGGVTFVSMPGIETASRGKMLAFLVRAALSFLRRNELRRCDALFASSSALPDSMPLLFAGRSNVTFIAHLLEAPWHRRGSFFWNVVASAAEALGLLATRFGSTAIVTCSHFVAGQLDARGVRQNAYVTTNGIDHIRFLEACPIRSGAICVGRLHAVKGTADLIRAWRKVVDAIPTALLTIVGDGDPRYRNEMHALVSKLRLDSSVRFEGAVDDLTRDHLLQQASFGVFPSYEEGWGIAVAEAFAAGLPCVTYDLPIFKEVFSRGRLAAPIGDVDALAKHAISLLTDDALRKALSVEAKEVVSTFTWERAAVIDGRAIVDTLAAHRRRPVTGT